MASDTLPFDVLIGIAGLVGLTMVIRAFRTAIRREDARDAERSLRWGLRLTNGGLFAIMGVDLVASEASRVLHWAFAVYVSILAIAALALFVPLRLRVTRVREANGWGSWPTGKV